jgi:phosphoribosylformylglycinamidine synthase
MNDVDGSTSARIPSRAASTTCSSALFAEELGAVIQIRRDDRSRFTEALRARGLGYHFVGEPNDRDELRFWRNAKLVFSAPARELLQAWSRPATRSPACATTPSARREEFEALADATPTRACRWR